LPCTCRKYILTCILLVKKAPRVTSTDGTPNTDLEHYPAQLTRSSHTYVIFLVPNLTSNSVDIQALSNAAAKFTTVSHDPFPSFPEFHFSLRFSSDILLLDRVVMTSSLPPFHRQRLSGIALGRKPQGAILATKLGVISVTCCILVE
jgi:hypothetical protein